MVESPARPQLFKWVGSGLTFTTRSVLGWACTNTSNRILITLSKEGEEIERDLFQSGWKIYYIGYLIHDMLYVFKKVTGFNLCLNPSVELGKNLLPASHLALYRGLCLGNLCPKITVGS